MPIMRSNHHLRHPKRWQPGVGLLEVLIALLVMSVGMLGLTALQATSLKNNRSAYIKTQAVVMAYDIIDRMRANKDQSDLYKAASGSACSSACTSAQTAANDLYEWQAQLAAELPSGTGSVTSILGIDKGYTIKVEWTEDGATNALEIGARL